MADQVEQHQKWWQKNKQLLIITTITIIAIFIAFALLVHWFGWDWTGFNGGYGKITIHTSAKDIELPPARTFWDWLGLIAALAIPVVVGFGAVWFTLRQGKVADAENKDNQRETALQAYIDKMSELLLETHLRDSQPQDEVRNIARVRTLTILRGLDAFRKASVLQFLYESGLIEKDNRIVDLSYADLSSANLIAFDLSGADLSKVNLRKTDLFLANLSETILNSATLTAANLFEGDLHGANLEKAFLDGADLSFADLLGTHLSEAILYNANLKGAENITTEELEKQTKSLKGATMPDGDIHD